MAYWRACPRGSCLTSPRVRASPARPPPGLVPAAPCPWVWAGRLGASRTGDGYPRANRRRDGRPGILPGSRPACGNASDSSGSPGGRREITPTGQPADAVGTGEVEGSAGLRTLDIDRSGGAINTDRHRPHNHRHHRDRRRSRHLRRCDRRRSCHLRRDHLHNRHRPPDLRGAWLR
jgi:hypothetical protein